jgi:hypothetical protein
VVIIISLITRPSVLAHSGDQVALSELMKVVRDEIFHLSSQPKFEIYLEEQ